MWIFFVVIFVLFSEDMYSQNTWSGPKVYNILPLDYEYTNLIINNTKFTEGQCGNIPEINYLYENNGSSVDSEGRFADGNSFFIYKLISPFHYYCKLDLKIGNNFLVSLSPDNSNWSVTLNALSIFKDDIHDVSNKTYQSMNISMSILKSAGTIYLKIADGSTSDGWGGKIFSLRLLKIPVYKNGNIIQFRVYTDKNSYTVQADSSVLDSNGKVTNAINLGDNSYRFNIPISSVNTKPNGIYNIPININSSYTANYIIQLSNPNTEYSNSYISLDSIKIFNNLYLITVKKNRSWDVIQFFTNSSPNLVLSETNFYKSMSGNSFTNTFAAGQSYYFVLRGCDIGGCGAGFMVPIVNITKDKGGILYAEDSTSYIKIDDNSIIENSIVYFNIQNSDYPPGINGLKYFRILKSPADEFYKQYELYLKYDNDVYDNQNISVYWYNNSSWEEIITAKDFSLANGGILKINFNRDGYFAIASGTSKAFVTVPNPAFSPNGDGINDTIIFNVETVNKAKITIRIFDLTGSIVSEVVKEREVFAPGTSFIWDGTDRYGRSLGVGCYIYKVTIDNSSKSGIIVISK